jgi:hypothetical protein
VRDKSTQKGDGMTDFRGSCRFPHLPTATWRTIMRSLVAIAAAVACAGLVAADAEAQRFDRDGRGGGRDRWVELGCKQVSFIGADRDVIRVGRADGRFKAIRLEARGNDVEMLDLKVVYSNGAPDDIRVRSMIRQGSRTRPLDLRGRERSIRQINMVYRKPLNFRGPATVCVEGLE